MRFLTLFFVLSLGLSAELPEHEIGIAVYLDKVCKADKTEHVVLYNMGERRLFDLTRNGYSSDVSVFIELPKILFYFRDGGEWIVAHCHIVNYDLPKKILSPERYKTYKEMLPKNKDLVRKYFLMEIPSGFEIDFGPRGDIYLAAELEMLSYALNKMTTIHHRLVVVEEGEPARIIAFGLSQQSAMVLRAEAERMPRAKSPGLFMVPTLKHVALASEYSAIYDRYTKRVCAITPPYKEGCIELDLKELIREINLSQKFFVKFIGTYP